MSRRQRFLAYVSASVFRKITDHHLSTTLSYLFVEMLGGSFSLLSNNTRTRAENVSFILDETCILGLARIFVLSLASSNASETLVSSFARCTCDRYGSNTNISRYRDRLYSGPKMMLQALSQFGKRERFR